MTVHTRLAWDGCFRTPQASFPWNRNWFQLRSSGLRTSVLCVCGRRHVSFQRFSNRCRTYPTREVQAISKSGHLDWQKLSALETSASRNAEQKGSIVAARTIPFPTPPGIAATRLLTSPPPPSPTGAARLITAPRRYRGLHLVHREHLLKMSNDLNRLAQTQAIVAQVEREIAERAKRERDNAQLVVLAPLKRSSSNSITRRAAHRVVMSLFPAGL
jgi:hypothetical protein